MIAYRIQRGDEPLEALYNPDREDGWVAGDETSQTQPRGISCCSSLEKLARYTRGYLMAVQPDDLLVQLCGEWSEDGDRDLDAERMIVTSAEVLYSGAVWLEAMEIADRTSFGDTPASVAEEEDVTEAVASIALAVAGWRPL